MALTRRCDPSTEGPKWSQRTHWGEWKVWLGDLGPTRASRFCGAFWFWSHSWLIYCSLKFRAPHCSAPPHERVVHPHPMNLVMAVGLDLLWPMKCRRKWCVSLLGKAESQGLVQPALSFLLLAMFQESGCFPWGSWSEDDTEQSHSRPTWAYNYVRNKPLLL